MVKALYKPKKTNLHLLPFFQNAKLTLLRPMEFSVKFDTVKSGLSITYIEGSQVMCSKQIAILSLKTDFVLANSTDPDDIQTRPIVL